MILVEAAQGKLQRTTRISDRCFDNVFVLPQLAAGILKRIAIALHHGQHEIPVLEPLISDSAR